VAQAEAVYLRRGVVDPEALRGTGAGKIEDTLYAEAEKAYLERERAIGPDVMRDLERVVVLRVVDQKWMDHLDAMDDLREGIGLRAYGQKDPLLEYQMEAHDMFEQMIEGIREDVVRLMFKLEFAREGDGAARVAGPRAAAPGVRGSMIPSGGGRPATQVRAGKKIGRNDPCPCGSGKKYKKCCGKTA
jgi:preprotein translocase subunit SecA